jgi:hypothetical protein
MNPSAAAGKIIAHHYYADAKAEDTGPGAYSSLRKITGKK